MTPVAYLDAFSLLLMGAALLIGTLRLFLGPTTADRVVAADLLGVITTAGLVWFALAVDNPIYLDVALVYGALAFVGVVAIARVLEVRKP